MMIEQRIEVVAHGQPQAELDRAPGDAHGGDVAALLGHPLGDFLIVADGGGQTDELDVGRCLDDDLFPDRAARKIIDVVDLIEDDVADALKPMWVLVNQVAQDFLVMTTTGANGLMVFSPVTRPTYPSPCRRR